MKAKKQLNKNSSQMTQSMQAYSWSCNCGSFCSCTGCNCQGTNPEMSSDQGNRLASNTGNYIPFSFASGGGSLVR